MSEIADNARVAMFVSDFAQGDLPSGGKVNALGVGWQFTTLTQTGNTPSQSLCVLIDVPQRFVGEQVALSLTLFDSGGDVVTIPMPDGTIQAVRIGQAAVVDRPTVPGNVVPSELPARIAMLVGLPAGLPLRPGQTYRWQLEIDGDDRQAWQVTFYVVAPVAPIVVG